MRRLFLAIILLLIPSVALAVFPIDWNWNSVGGGFTCVNRTKSGAFPDIHYSAEPTSGTPDPPNALKITFPEGWPATGAEPASCWGPFGGEGRNEVYIQYYIKYSTGYQWHPVFDKSMYLLTGTGQYYVFWGAGHGKPGIRMQSNMEPTSRGQNIGTGFVFQTGRWYKINLHFKMNTGSSTLNGIGEMWVDDVKIMSYNTFGFDSDLSGFSQLDITPVWGGVSPGTYKLATDYHWYDRTIVQSTPIGGGGADTSPPYTDQHSPVKSSTGVLKTNRTISFHVKDNRTNDTGVSSGTISAVVEDSTRTCSAGLSCTGSSSDYTVTYTNGSDWAYDQVVNVSISASDVQGLAMATDTYSYTIQSAPPLAVEITTTTLPAGTVGTPYSQTLASTGGVKPYTYDNTGTLPPGLSLSSSGDVSGTPTTAGTYAWQARVTDNVSATDNQALSITVNSCLPGGCGVTVTGVAFTDTFINSGAADTNYGTSTTMTAYQWPSATVANRIILVNSSDISALPDNIAITSAKIRLYMTGHEGSGGTNPMRVHAKSISGTLPDPATVTWTSFAGTLSADLSVTDVTLVSGWFEFDVTSYVAAQHANSKAAVYIALDGSNDGATDTNRIFASVNNATTANRPQLVIVYTQMAGDPPVSISAPGKMRVVKLKGSFR